MEIEQVFGEILSKFRVKKSLWQEELSHVCKLDRSYISLMERGKGKPAINTIFALAKVLNEKPSNLVFAAEELLDLEGD